MDETSAKGIWSISRQWDSGVEVPVSARVGRRLLDHSILYSQRSDNSMTIKTKGHTVPTMPPCKTRQNPLRPNWSWTIQLFFDGTSSSFCSSSAFSQGVVRPLAQLKRTPPPPPSAVAQSPPSQGFCFAHLVFWAWAHFNWVFAKKVETVSSLDRCTFYDKDVINRNCMLTS